jgi:hypothetical protein
MNDNDKVNAAIQNFSHSIDQQLPKICFQNGAYIFLHYGHSRGNLKYLRRI